MDRADCVCERVPGHRTSYTEKARRPYLL